MIALPLEKKEFDHLPKAYDRFLAGSSDDIYWRGALPG
jgi:hypothetical protein